MALPDRYYSCIGLMLEREKPSSADPAPEWKLFFHDLPKDMLPIEGDRVTFWQASGVFVAHPESRVTLTFSIDSTGVRFVQDACEDPVPVQVRPTYASVVNSLSFHHVRADWFLNPEPCLVVENRPDAGDECMVCYDPLGSDRLFGCPDCRKVLHLACALKWRSHVRELPVSVLEQGTHPATPLAINH